MKNYIARNDTNAVVQEWDGFIIGPEHEVLWSDYQQWLAEGNTPTPATPDLPPSEPNIEEKLASVGLSINDLKQVLGITK